MLHCTSYHNLKPELLSVQVGLNLLNGPSRQPVPCPALSWPQDDLLHMQTVSVCSCGKCWLLQLWAIAAFAALLYLCLC